MNPPASLGDGNRGHHWPKWLRLLAVVFTIATIGSLLLVATDFIVGRPSAGDLFIACLNALAAAVLWREVSRRAPT